MTEKLTGVDIWIGRTTDPGHLLWCAQLMAANEPWVTLGRGYAASLALLQDPLAEVFLLSNGHEHAGFVMVKMKGAFTGYIQNIAVAPAFRAQGIGSAVLAYIENYIFSCCPNVFICVSDFNHGARKLYEKCGYEPVGWLKNYVVQGHDELLLRKTIGPVQAYEPRQRK